MVINIQDDILKLHAMGLLDRLLQDKTTKGNILWATDAYSHLGEWYTPGNEIRPQRITGENSDLIKTRARRAMEQRTERTRQHAEVFTPLWIVKKMNDFADEQWFDRKTGIYKLTEEGKIYFNTKKHWKLYVDARRLEITCGEAPFLATRYDVETGEAIPIEDRIGLLDRKLRAVTENTQDIKEWKTWALRAVQSIYGYELQGDNLLIARINILYTVEEHMFRRWRQRADKEYLGKLCNVIAWNLWQMDGINGCVPVPPKPTDEQLSLFEPIEQYSETNLFGEITEKAIPCRLFDWRGDRSISYETLRKKGSELMKFDFVIGNPPYQDESQRSNGYAAPIYHNFLECAYSVAEKASFIHPARFLFNAGSTPKDWNRKMLLDPHFKVLFYTKDSSSVFHGVDIKGGVAITYRDETRVYGAIETFTPYQELNSILHKVREFSFTPMSETAYVTAKFDFDVLLAEKPECSTLLKERRLATNVFDLLDGIIFFAEKPGENDNYIRVYGRTGATRVYRWVKREYIDIPDNLDRFKLFLPKVNGIGSFGEIIVDPVIGAPGEINTHTFMSIGSFKTENEARAALKYIKTKFARAMLGILKITQHNSNECWKYVPLQDFTHGSDIDWSKSITEIDQQLYTKYGLDETEIAFIESHVKEMS